MISKTQQPAHLTRERLADAINRVQRAINLWSASDQPRTSWRGRDVKCVSESLVSIFNGLIEVVSVANAEDKIKRIIFAVDSFDLVLAEWALGCSNEPDQVNPAGSEELWDAWRNVISKFNEKQRSKPSPISAYDQQELSDRQIALIYFWKTDGGDPDTERVLREREDPGSEYNPESWIHPFDTADSEETQRKWEERQSLVETKVAELSVSPEAPESIYELLQQRVSSRQILAMKRGSTYEGICNVAKAHHLEVDGVLLQVDHQSDSAIDPSPEVQGNPSQQQDPQSISELELEPTTKQILPPSVYDNEAEKRGYLVNAVNNLQLTGASLEEIVESLAEDFPTITTEHVAIVSGEIAASSLGTL